MAEQENEMQLMLKFFFFEDKVYKTLHLKKSKKEKENYISCPYPLESNKSPKVICPKEVIEGNLITKEKRKELFGNVAGGSGSIKPENFQREMIKKGTNLSCDKTNVRINLRNFSLENISRPNVKRNGFDYSEDFDGFQKIHSYKIYLNLKCIVGKGGSQTRSLREVYWFIEGQLNVLKKNENIENIYFANILDGDEAFSCKDKFEYLKSLSIYSEIKDKIYIGDLKNYFKWFEQFI